MRKVPYSDEKPYLIEVVDPTMQDCPECKRRESAAQYHPHRGMSAEDKDKFFNGSVVDHANASAFKQCRAIASSMKDHLKTGFWAYIYGDPVRARVEKNNAFGTGKSHMLCCIANEIAGQLPALFITESELFAEIYDVYAGVSKASESEVLDKYTRLPILLIDDLFKVKPTERVESLLYRLIEGRNKRGRVTIITSNVMPDRIHQVLNVEATAGAIQSRLKNLCTLIELMGPDRREKKHGN